MNDTKTTEMTPSEMTEEQKRAELHAAEAGLRQKIARVRREAAEQERTVIRTHTDEIAVLGRAKDTGLVLERQRRDAARRTAEADYQIALRRAQGDRDRALAAADLAYTAARDEQNAIFSEASKPIGDRLAARQAEIRGHADAMIAELQLLFDAAYGKLKAEIRALDDKKAPSRSPPRSRSRPRP